ncbi:unnamed protein product [Adineta steineri]|uniref:HAT C-terminal dimerisation domain-containing protein n=1 Tax=Adineta steineri TaxID=433720 RepID=A0A818W2V4_9BILA|nr:unnamed protein product [Adineta steineri]
MDQCIQVGYMYGPLPASSFLSCRKTVTKEIKRVAIVGRNQMKVILISAARERRLSLSPDLWSDGYKKVSYLGCTAQWVDRDWNLCTFELFCLPYRKPNKTAVNVLQVIEEGLALYDLQPFMFDIIWVCDRGSNLKKALEKYNVVHCIAHRLNNTLQKTFYQLETSKAKKDVAFGDYYINPVDDEDDQISSGDSEEENVPFDDDDVRLIDRLTRSVNQTTVAPSRNNATTTLAQLPSEAKRALVTIIHTKELVKYIKKTNLNQDLEDRGAAVLVQNKLIEFLKPWTFVMKRIQSSLIPSIHTVTPSIFIINTSLDVKPTDAKQEKGIMFFRQRAKQVMKEMICFDPIHLMGTFFNPKTRHMKHLTAKQREECIEYVKQEMLMMDIDHQVQLPLDSLQVQPITTTSNTYMTDFYLIIEQDDHHSTQQSSSKTSSHIIEIDLYLKLGSDKTTIANSDQENQEYNPLSFWKKKHESYPILSKVAARILGVPATSAAVEREFSFTGNIITQKRSKLLPDTVNDIVFNHSYNKFKQRFGDISVHKL